MTTTIDIHALLAKTKRIADIWGIDDVHELRPDLSDDQAWEVLQATVHGHDANMGINWDVLEYHADRLYGTAPAKVDEDEP